MMSNLKNKLLDLRNGLFLDAESVNRALDECLALVEGEPVAWMTEDGRVDTLNVGIKTRGGKQWGPQYFGKHWSIPLYRHPQPVLSTDYGRLYDLLCGGGEALSRIMSGGWRKARECFGQRHKDGSMHLFIESEGHFTKDDRDFFLSECTRLSLEWVAVKEPENTQPTQQQAQP